MINFCKKSVHSLLNITSQEQDSIMPVNHRPGLSFLVNFDDIPKPNNVIESTSLINGSLKIKEAIASEISPSMERDHVDIGIRVLEGVDVDRLASCTESLGFESCTERSMSSTEIDFFEKTRVKRKSKILEKRQEKINRKMKVFPPPLTTLNDNGKPNFVLQPVRKDGRLVLTAVQIQRQETLYVHRENGRLIMHLVEQDYSTSDGDDDVSVGSEDKLGDTKDKKVVEEEYCKVSEDCDGGEGCSWFNEVVEEECKAPENCDKGENKARGEDCKWLNEVVEEECKAPEKCYGGEDKASENRDGGEDCNWLSEVVQEECKAPQNCDGREDYNWLNEMVQEECKAPENCNGGEDKAPENRDEGEDKAPENCNGGEDKVPENCDKGEECNYLNEVIEDECKALENCDGGEDKAPENCNGEEDFNWLNYVVQEECKAPAENCNGGEACSWLNEVVVDNHDHQNHDLHGWGHHCVTIR